MKLDFSYKYFLITVLIFVVEVIIATVLKDLYLVRAFFGDVLVVILIYTFVLSFFRVKNKKILSVSVFLFAVQIEVLQYLKLADYLGFREGSVAHIVLGNYFSWGDIVCYAIGCLSVFYIDK